MQAGGQREENKAFHDGKAVLAKVREKDFQSGWISVHPAKKKGNSREARFLVPVLSLVAGEGLFGAAFWSATLGLAFMG